MSGEKPDDRAAIDRMTRRIMSEGVPAPAAVEKAKDSMRRVDQKLRDEGRR